MMMFHSTTAAFAAASLLSTLLPAQEAEASEREPEAPPALTRDRELPPEELGS